ncbi:hypothetical protein [Helicobacter bilis]|nr:hypothetical protein [Helicobacter bilis]
MQNIFSKIACFIILAMSGFSLLHYILKHYHTIKLKENTIEKRKESYVASKEQLIKEHSALKAQCKQYKLPFVEIQEDYENEMQGVVVMWAMSDK